jgi:hypothetical protein
MREVRAIRRSKEAMSVLDKAESKKAAEYRKAIIEGFEVTNGDMRATARRLGVSREFVRRWCHRLDIDVNDYRKPRKKWVVGCNGKHLGDVMASTERQAIAEAVRVYDVPKEDIENINVLEVSE